MKQFIKNRLQESMDFNLIENLMAEDYPTSFDMAHFKTLRRYSERVRYCEANLRRISSGSARIVYMVDNTKVLKLAKNEKGVAQCETEIQWGNDSYFGDILAKTLDSHPDGLFVEMELARKVKPSDFKRIHNIDFRQFGTWLGVRFDQNHGKRSFRSVDPEVAAMLEENEFATRILEFADNTDSFGDLTRLNSYGLVTREGTDSIVIIDFGLTGEVYSTYYDRATQKAAY